MLKLLYVYKFATFGGVERVLLSRVEAFKLSGIAVKIFLYFLEDRGALDSIQAYIDTAKLTAYVTIVKSIREHDYDYIVSIDTPEILKYKINSQKLLFECHTTYVRERVYLSRLAGAVRMIAVPSVAMKVDLEHGWPQLKGKIALLRNYVAAPPVRRQDPGVFWQKRPLLYLGRMDEHKNIGEVLDVFARYRSHYGDDVMLVLAGMVAESIDLQGELRQRHLIDRTVVLPPVRFDRVQQLYALVRCHQGVFISSSQAESFALSVAEAMVNGLPVLLSGIRAHGDLVSDDMDFLYPLGDATAGAMKLHNIVSNYNEMQKRVDSWRERFSVATFIEDWNCFIKLLLANERCSGC